jgi:hypothetical protein
MRTLTLGRLHCETVPDALRMARRREFDRLAVRRLGDLGATVAEVCRVAGVLASFGVEVEPREGPSLAGHDLRMVASVLGAVHAIRVDRRAALTEARRERRNAEHSEAAE